MDTYHPGTVFSSIDQEGRYAFGNQPQIAEWNLARLAETLLPILSDSDKKSMELAQASIGAFGEKFQAACTIGLRKKLGLVEERSGDLELAHDLLGRMGRDCSPAWEG